MAGTLEYEQLNKNLEVVDGHAVKAPEDYQDPEQLYQALVARVRKYHPSTDISMIEKAYRIAKEAHKDQVRKSGEPYIIHPLWVGIILADLEMDKETIVAGMLHDAVEDTAMTLDDITKEFGEEVALLVDGVTKLGQLSYSQDKLEVQAENLRKMFLAMAKDIRVIIIKLADRLHNMRTLEFMTPAKQQEKARETMDIYAPIAQRLGISKIKTELDDLSLKYWKPDVYYQLVKDLNERKTEREEFVQQIVAEVSKHMKNAHIRAKVYGRVKHFFSIYKKMVNQNKTLDQVYDLFAVRIIVDTVEHCYEVLSLVHENFTVLSKEYDDYIANPKPNGYQSLHTVVTDPHGRPVEIQIRTRAMHEFAELGVAAHWRYKETGNSNKDKGAEAEEQRVAWLRQLLDWKSDVAPPAEPGLEDDHVYALTPQGRVVELQKGATPIDFAYQVHTELGHRCRGARIDGQMVPLNTQIKTGQTVEIVAAKTGGPSRDWLNPELGFAVSARTRTKVRQWFNAQKLAEQTQAGRERLDRELARLGKTAVKLEELAKRLGYDSVDDLCVAFAKEEFSLKALEQAVQPQVEEPEPQPEVLVRSSQAQKSHKSNVLVVGIDSLMTQLAKCCHPAPPDEIIGFITRGRGVTIHRIDCPNVKNLVANDQERMIEVGWGNQAEAVYPVDIYIVARDRQGLLKDVSEVFMREKQNITGLNTVNVKGDAHMRISIEIRSSEDLRRSLSQLRELKGVMSVRRA